MDRRRPVHRREGEGGRPDRRRRAPPGVRGDAQGEVRRRRRLRPQVRQEEGDRSSTSPRRSPCSSSGRADRRGARRRRAGQGRGRHRLRRGADHPRAGAAVAASADGEATSSDIRKALDEAARDDSIKAVVLRVDSPGGSAVASEIILDATRRVKAKKPFVVSMGDVAGSGGYYVACAVRHDLRRRVDDHRLDRRRRRQARDHRDVGQGRHHVQALRSAARTPACWPSDRPFTPKERERMQAWMDEIYGRLQGPRHGQPRRPAQEADRRAGRRPRLHRQAGAGARAGRQDRHAGGRHRARRRGGEAERLRRPRRPRAEELHRADHRGVRRARTTRRASALPPRGDEPPSWRWPYRISGTSTRIGSPRSRWPSSGSSSSSRRASS